MNNRIIYHPLTATPFKRNRFYTELSPCKELQSYIRCYWGTENPLIQIENDDAPKLVIPDTCVDIIYHIDYTNNTVTGGFCGINDCSFHAHNSGTIGHTVSTFAIRYYAWSAYAFADDSLQSTINGYFDVGSRFEWLDKIMLVIKVVETKTRAMIDKCLDLTAYDAQYRIPWIVFDRDQVQGFDEIIAEAMSKGIQVGWSNPCHEYPYYRTKKDKRLSLYAICPECGNPIQIVNMYGEEMMQNVTRKIILYGKHTGRAVEGFPI